MVTVLKRGTTKARIKEIVEKFTRQRNAGFDAKRFCGTIKLHTDPSKIQKQLRDEWS